MFGGGSRGSGKQDATATATFTAAGSQNVTPELPGGATGRPIKVKASGSVSGVVLINVGTQAQLALPVNPNAPYTERDIPANAFPSPVNNLPLTIQATGAGAITVVVTFA